VSTARYKVLNASFPSPCDHPLCEQLHRRFMERSITGAMFHDKMNTMFVIIDTETDERAFGGEQFDTMREAKAYLAVRMARKAEVTA